MHNDVCFGALCVSIRRVSDVGFQVIELCDRDGIDILTGYFVRCNIRMFDWDLEYILHNATTDRKFLMHYY